MKGYCSAYIVPTEKYDKEYHIIVEGFIYAPVAKTSSCNEWENKYEN